MCHKSFKVKATDFEKEMQTCVLSDCDLKQRREELSSIVSIAIKVVPIRDLIEITIPDPVVIREDKNGVETRTVS